MRLKLLSMGVLCVLASSAQAISNQTADNNSAPSKDPHERFNRSAYHLNDGIDRAVLKPLATIYNTLIPWPLAKGISNFFRNIDDVPAIPNDILQGKFQQALSDLWRVSVNTTLGLGGLFDVSSKIGLEKHPQDFGLTLAQWGYKQSDYFVIPLIGPSTVRDAIAMPINMMFFTVYSYIEDVPLRNSVWAGKNIVYRSDNLKFEKTIEAAAYDPYVFQRDAYTQHRKYLINQNNAIDQNDTYVSEK